MINVKVIVLDPGVDTCSDMFRQSRLGSEDPISFEIACRVDISTFPQLACRLLTNVEYDENTTRELQDLLIHANVWESVAVDEDRWGYIIKTDGPLASLPYFETMQIPKDADVIFFDTILDHTQIDSNNAEAAISLDTARYLFYPVCVENSGSRNLDEYLLHPRGARKLLKEVVAEGFFGHVGERIIATCLKINSTERMTRKTNEFNSPVNNREKAQPIGFVQQLQGYVMSKVTIPAHDLKEQTDCGNQIVATENSNTRSFTKEQHSGQVNMGQHWARVVMTQRTREMVKNLVVTEMDALEISGDYWRWGWDWRSFKSASYPDFNICYDTLNGEKFDIVFAEQVFEHLPYPYRAARNVFRMLRPGGLFLLTLPFLIKLHPMPYDCSRWTPQGLKFFLQECGFDQSSIVVDSWGNRECINANFESWVEYIPGLHSLENEPDFPIVVWALARKEL